MLSTHITDKNKAHNISKALNTSYYHHGYAVSRSEAKSIGLDIINPSKELENLLWSVWEDFSNEMQCNDSFDPVKEIMSNPTSSEQLNKCTYINYPLNTPPAIAQQIIAQHAQSFPVTQISPIKIDILIAAIESSYLAKAVYNNISMLYWRNPDMSLGINATAHSSGWVMNKEE